MHGSCSTSNSMYGPPCILDDSWYLADLALRTAPPPLPAAVEDFIPWVFTNPVYASATYTSDSSSFPENYYSAPLLLAEVSKSLTTLSLMTFTLSWRQKAAVRPFEQMVLNTGVLAIASGLGIGGANARVQVVFIAPGMFKFVITPIVSEPPLEFNLDFDAWNAIDKWHHVAVSFEGRVPVNNAAGSVKGCSARATLFVDGRKMARASVFKSTCSNNVVS